MKKIYVYICLLAAAALIFTSCGSKETINLGQAATKGPVTLVFSTFYEEGSQADGYKEIIKAFESTHSNIKVTLQASPINYDENIKTSLQTGKGPDILGLQRSKMIEYAKLGNLKDISSWAESDNLKSKYYGVSLGYGKYDGKYYGIGDMPYVSQWYYNVDMFKKAGLGEPTNLTELINACKKLKNYTQYPIMAGLKDPWASDVFFGMLTGQAISTDALSKAFGLADKSAFASLNGAQESVNIFNQLLQAGAINKKLTEYDYAQAIDAFVKGKAAILPMGSWAIDKIEKTKPKDFNYKAFEKPVMLTENPNSLYSASGVQVITINENSKHPEEAMEFMKYLFSEEAQKIFAAKSGISGFKTVNSEPASPVKKQVLKDLAMTDENSTMYIDNITNKMIDVTGNRLLQLIMGKIKPAEVWNLIVEESHV